MNIRRRRRVRRKALGSGEGLRIESFAHARGFRLRGDLDVFSVDRARAALEPELHGTLVLDVAGLDFIDDSGLGLLVSIVRRLGGQGGSLTLRNPVGQVSRVLEVTGVNRLRDLTIEVVDPDHR